MAWSVRRIVGAVLVACCAAGVGGEGREVARGDEGASADPAVARRAAQLRRRAADWWQVRQRLTYVCHQCRGAGKVLYGRRGLVQCPKCDGRSRVVDADRYRKIHYEMRSPAFRVQEGVRERLEAEYLQARSGNPWPAILKRYRIAEVTLVGDAHGVVAVEEDDDRTAKPQRWVFAEEKGKGEWFLWDAAADGPWPDRPAATVAPGADAGPGPTARVLGVLYDRTLPRADALLWRLTVQVETRDVEGPVRWILSGLWLDFVLAESEGPPRWQVVSHAANAATFQIGGTLRSELCPEVQALTPEQWKDDLRIRAALASELPPPEPEPSPAPSSAPAPRDPAVAAAPSVASPLLDPADSRAQLEKWAEEDRDRQGRVDAFRERLPEISGPTEVTERAKAFLAEVDVWLAEARTQVERIARDLERPGATLALPDRSKVNILYFRAHRNLVMVKDLLPASLD